MFQDSERPLYEIKANLFKGLSHPYRIRILEILVAAPACDGQPGEVAVSGILAETGLEASHLSQHLAVLRRNRLVQSQRRGSVVFYRLAFAEVAELLRVARSVLGEVLTETKTHLDAAESLR